MRFGVIMYCNVIFSKSYHSLSLELGWKNYELRSEVIRNYFYFKERENFDHYISWTISSFGVKLEGFIDICNIFSKKYHTINLELECESYKFGSRVVMSYL